MPLAAEHSAVVWLNVNPACKIGSWWTTYLQGSVPCKYILYSELSSFPGLQLVTVLEFCCCCCYHGVEVLKLLLFNFICNGGRKKCIIKYFQ